MGIVGSACCQSQPCLVDQGELVLTNHAMAFHTEQSMDSFRSVVDDSEEENHSGLTSARGWPNYYRDTYNKLFRRRRSGRSRAGGGSAGGKKAKPPGGGGKGGKQPGKNKGSASGGASSSAGKQNGGGKGKTNQGGGNKGSKSKNSTKNAGSIFNKKGTAPPGNCNSGSDDSRRFLQQLVFKIPQPENVAKQILVSGALWEQCWADAVHFSYQQLHNLATLLACIPFSSEVPPPPLHSWKDAMAKLVDLGEKNKNALQTIETLLNVVKKMLEFEWEEEECDSVRNVLSEILEEATKPLSIREKDEKSAKRRAEDVIEEIQEKAWIIKKKPSAATQKNVPPSGSGENGTTNEGGNESGDADEQNLLHYTQWPNATLAWLCHAPLFTPSLLPRMEGPSTKSKGVYESPENYVETLQRLMIAMAFSERAIHWKSTKRLGAPNLVGIVKLENGNANAGTSRAGGAVRGRALRMTDRILWGEVASHGIPKDEYKEREQGRLCITMNSIVRDFDPESLCEGDVIAIIDCMTFVPEYIPVLRALELQAQTPLPFQEGAMLNLNAKQPADTSNCVSLEDTTLLQNASAGGAVPPRSLLKTLVEEMISESTLQPIREIRQNSGLRSELSREMVELIEKTTLDKGQLVNFVDSLRNAVHLTHGPPGTGKSYLGVVVVRALMCIRKLWMRQNPSVGQPPILVLSYKNHAADEFLTDLVKAEPQAFRAAFSPFFNQSRGGGRFSSSAQLVRMGKTEVPELQQYCENRLVLDSDPRLYGCKNALAELNDLRKACHAVKKASLLFNSYQSDMFNHDSRNAADEANADRKRRRAAYEATEVLLAAIVRARKLKESFVDNFAQDGESAEDAGGNSPFDELGSSDDGNSDSVPSIEEQLRKVASFMTLDKSGDERFGELQKLVNKDKDMKDGLATLYGGIAHYIECDPRYDQPHEILLMFLNGQRPFPRCRYHEHKWPDVEDLSCIPTCVQVAATEDVELCDQHRCRLPVGPPNQRRRCEKPIHPYKRYLCSDHACWVQGCEEPCVRNKAYDSCSSGEVEQLREYYCGFHACFKCRELGVSPAKLACDEQPRNVCEDHPLCCQPDCTELSEPNEDYCKKHSWPYCRHQIVGGMQCRSWSVTRDIPYCQLHIESFFAAPGAEPELMCTSTIEGVGTDDAEFAAAIAGNGRNRICKGKNRKGQACGSNAMAGADFCHAHAPPPNIKESESKSSSAKEDVAQIVKHFPPSGESGNKNTASKSTTDADPQAFSPDGFDTPRSSVSIASQAGGKHAQLGQDVPDGAERNVDAKSDEGDQGRSDGFAIGSHDESDDDQDDSSGRRPPPGLDFADMADRYDNIDEVEEGDGVQRLREIFEMDDEGQQDDNGGEAEYDTLEFSGAGSQAHERDNRHTATGPPPPGQGCYGSGPASSTADDTNFATPPTSDFPPNTNYIPPHQWHWNMTLAERWDACQEFMFDQITQLQAVLECVKQQHVVARKRLRDAEVRAKAKVYENKTVIGGTIVGCIMRLEAIRATQPFAVIVEEASEVLEPLLFSCLGPSTTKFEMIGDHLQLQPNLMDKWDFMRRNRVNVSMFERLVLAPNSHLVPHGVLSIQRRMRADVADLTREYYKDITAIEDHAVCATKILPGATAARSFWQGREVPGVGSHLFLWTHRGQQSKADVGKSNINRDEAKRCVYLAYYLSQCGVKPESIAILTPYKGQLMLLRKMLLQDKTKSRLLDWDNTAPNQVRLSTVDRFQGDEADVVIISLVVDENSPTPFVKQVNRMIVLLSRARLGMYVLGNVGYFDFEKRRSESQEVKHWMRTLELLEKAPENSDNARGKNVIVPKKDSEKLLGADFVCPEATDDPTGAGIQVPLTHALFKDVRVGQKLPLCCPQHPLVSTTQAQKAEDLQLGFCEIACEEVLPCSHPCGLKCHWPSKKHNTTCKAPVPSPCNKHPGEIQCVDVYKNASKDVAATVDIAKALKFYKCPVKVSVTLPCGHEEEMTCAEEDAILSGSRRYPECKRPSPKPYIRPSCGHEFNVTCAQLVQYEKSPATVPKCEKKVQYSPKDCEHEREIPCYLQQQYANGTAVFQCPKRVSVLLPRCGHSAKVACAEEVRLRQWQPGPGKERCADVGMVCEGVRYGPKDYTCREETTFVRKCGHEQKMPCEQAFVQAEVKSPCQEMVEVKNPHCGHLCKIKCVDAGLLDPSQQGPTSPQDVLNQNTTTPFPRTLPRGMDQCNCPVTLHRDCGHVERTTCARARRIPLHECSEMVTVRSPLCGHEISVPCRLRAAVEKWKPWCSAVEEQLQTTETLPFRAKARTGCGRAPDAVADCLKQCSKKVTVSKSCGHTFRETCSELLQIVADGGEVKKGANCSEKVTRPLRCGHEVTVTCKKWQKYVVGQEDIQCKQKVQKPCWNASECGSTNLLVQCAATAGGKIVCCDKETAWICTEAHEHPFKLCRYEPPTSCPTCNDTDLDVAIDYANSKTAAPGSGAPHEDPSVMTAGVSDSVREQKGSLFGRLFSGSGRGSSTSRAVPSCVVNTCLTSVDSRLVTHLPMGEDDIGDFWREQAACLQKFKQFRGQSTQPTNAFEKQLFRPALIPVFFVLSAEEKKRREQQVGFRKKSQFVTAKTLGGIGLHRLTVENLRKVAGAAISSSATSAAGKVHMLCGYLYTIKSRQNCEWPTKKTEKNVIKTWREAEGCDTIELKPKSSTDASVLIVWSPYPLYATHCVGPLTADDLLDWCNDLDLNHTNSLAPVDLSPQGVQFHERGGGTKPVIGQPGKPESASSSGDYVSGTSSAEANEDTSSASTTPGGSSVVDALAGSAAESLLFPNQLKKSAADEKDVLDISKTMGKHRAAELGKKLSFVNPDAPLFAGKKILEKLAGPDSQNNAQEDTPGYSDKSRTRALLLHVLAALEFRSCDDTNRAEEELQDPADQWADMKETENCRSDAMDNLLKLTGLRRVKIAALQLFKKGLAFASMDSETRKKNAPSLNYVFLGNPGTGKTTVARLFAQILHDSGLRKKETFEENSAQELKDAGVDEFKKKAKAAMDGVLFIDEAYNLDPVGDKFKGGPIANELLTLSENERERLTFILAGYEDELNDKLFAYNPGFKSRFTEVVFEDFDFDELLQVWNHLRKERKWREADERLGKVVVRRLAKMRGRKGFGNARDVRKKLEEATSRAMARPDFNGGDLVLEIADAIGENPVLNEKLAGAIEEINRKTGWAAVKAQIRNLVEVCGENYKRELSGQPALPIFLNRMFLGNPGTGKTTCAKLYGQVLKHLGFLSNGEVVEKTVGDLGGAVVGEAKQKTVSLLEACRGKVLLIDEAYGLDDNLYGKQALDALVEKVQGTEADDIAVLLLGYEEQMLQMLNRQNPGLKRRFAPDQAFRFEDYSDTELDTILMNECKKNLWVPALEFREKAMKMLARQKRSGSHFGNAGSVHNLLKAALTKASAARKCDDEGKMQLKPEDIELPEDAFAGEDPFAALDKLYRMEEIKKKLKDLKALVDAAEEDGDSPPDLGHFVFVGAPGTGKTTVASIVAKILYRSGFLARDHVEITTGQDLTGEAAGTTKAKVKEALEKAQGGVLFVDEAYELGKGAFGSEACTALVAAMTSDAHKGVVIIFAGYQAEIQNMLKTNAGLKSRFQNFYEFPDWNPADCVHMFQSRAESESVQFEDANTAAKILEKGFDKLRKLDGWANARDVSNVWKKAALQRVQREKSRTSDGCKTLSTDDIKNALDVEVNTRMGNIATSVASADKDSDPFAPLDGLYRMDDVKQTLQAIKSRRDQALQDGEDPPALGHFTFTGAPGTGKTTVARVFAEILCKLQLIGRNLVVETTGRSLTGEYVGSTAKVVHEKLDQAKGGVLFIDEAYDLGKSQYGEEAVTTLVAAMTNPTYAGIVMIFAGYQDEIHRMLDTNEGLKSRITRHLRFPDWTPEDCADEIAKTAARKNFALEEDENGNAIRIILLQGFKRVIPLKGWGNARDVTGFWDRVMEKRAQRSTQNNDEAKRILIADVKTAMNELLAARGGSSAADGALHEDPFADLDNLYRVETIKKELQRLRDTFEMAKRDDEDPPPLGHFIFVGAPGTGKTTVARVMATILHRLGLIGRNNVVQTSGLELTGQYVGQTKKVVEEQLEKAKGGVLFIDEAYTLGRGQYGAEAVDTLVAAMTDPQYANLVVVIAGYPADIDEMLDGNAGLKSRLSRTIEFPDWTPEDCVACFEKKAADSKFATLPETAKVVLEQGFAKLRELDGWGNARDVEDTFRKAKEKRASRSAVEKDQQQPSITVEVEQQEHYAERQQSVEVEQQQEQEAVSMDEICIEAQVEEKGTNDGSNTHAGIHLRDPGVSDADWAALQAAKAEEKAYEEECRLEEEKRKRIEAEIEAQLRAKQLAQEEYEAKMRKLQQEREEAERRRRDAERIQENLRRIGKCPVGFAWYKSGGGWRCGGGSHFVSDAELHKNFSVPA
eukprot:g6771.t1